LSIEGEGDGAIITEHWLLPVRHVDNGEASVTQADAGRSEVSFSVRPSMRQGIGHLPKQALIYFTRRRSFEDACDTTHLSVSHSVADSS
jgi:hypothetical protein